jgi:hypothetical protein
MKTIAAGLAKEYPRDNKGRTVELFPLNESALGINRRRQFSLAGGVLMGVVGLVLLIACVNLANLLLAQAAKRERELSIRAAMGAGRFRLIRQLLTEAPCFRCSAAWRDWSSRTGGAICCGPSSPHSCSMARLISPSMLACWDSPC